MTTKESSQKTWYALYTKPRWEKKIDAVLQRKGIHSWCPLQKVQKQWSDRKKVVEEPLFKSYVFVKIAETDRVTVLATNGVLNFVHYLGRPAIIRDAEIEMIQKYLAEKEASLSVHALEGFSENERIRVGHGVFMDKEGTVVRGGKRKVYVKLESLGQVMVVEFPTEYLIPL